MILRHEDTPWDAPSGGGMGVTNEPVRSKPIRPAAARGRDGNRLATINLHGVNLHSVTEKQCVQHILDEVGGGNGGTVITPNLDHLRRCVRDLNFGALVSEASLIVADGMPLVWASKLQGTPLPERVAGSNLISSLSAGAADSGRSIFLLGGAEGTADGAADVLRKRHPNLKIAGTFSPRLGFEKNPKQMAEIVQKLQDSAPDIIFVALGSPKQELLIARLKASLPKSWWLGVGVSFSFLTGHVRRAPKVMQILGIEWLHRLFQEPRRLFKRYIVSGLPFAAVLFGRAAYRGVPQRLGWYGRPSIKPVPKTDVSPNGFLRVAAPDRGESGNTVNDRLAQRARRTAITLNQSESTSLSRLKAVVLLGGHVRPTPLSTSIGRSLLDLPLDENGSVLSHWLSHSAELAKIANLEKLPVRVMVDRHSPEPISAAVKHYGTFRVERDQSEYRGTGGVLGDMAERYDDDDLILVANAAQILLDPLISLATSLDERRGDVALISHRDGTPSGMMLVSCKTLRLIPKTGFIDMKEQAMPLIASKFAVEVIHRRRSTGLPIRTATDYIAALRQYHIRRQGKPSLNDPLAEDWQPAFSIIEEGAIIDPSVRVHDSVVLRGAVVEPGAVLVRSIICPNGLVRRDHSAVDEFVKPVSNSKIISSPLLTNRATSDKGKAA